MEYHTSMRRFMLRFSAFVVFCILIFAGWNILSARIPREFTIELYPGLSRIELSKTIGMELGWDDQNMAAFASVYAQMQWAEFNTIFRDLLKERFDWGEDEQEIFVTNSTKYFKEASLDFFAGVYVPGIYTLSSDLSIPEIAGILIQRLKETVGDGMNEFIDMHINEDSSENIRRFVEREYELLPDLVPLPPQDLRIDKVDDRILLSFTTVYYNQGRGPLELRADTKTAGIRKDIERDVHQRIYRPDGSYRDRIAGTFLWHQAHLHYHFADFIVYDLEAVDVKGETPDLSGVLAKSTFCIRDISRISLDLPNRADDAVYEICGKEKQGISVGWGDAYFYTYPDQNLNIADLPSGTYRLKFIANPDNRFEEVTRDNNESDVLMAIDMEALTVKILEETPKEIPVFEHVYPVQENCSACTL